MEQLIQAVAFSIMIVGFATSILAVIGFTRCFGNSPEAPPEGAAQPEAQNSTGMAR